LIDEKAQVHLNVYSLLLHKSDRSSSLLFCCKKIPLIDGTGEQVSSNNTCLPSQIGLVISTGVIKAVAARQQVKKKTSYVTIIAN
jgi:hypothetical protein